MAVKYRLIDKDRAKEVINRLNEISNNSTSTKKSSTGAVQLPMPNNSKADYLNNNKSSLIKPIETNIPFTNNVLPEDAKKLTSTDVKAMKEAIDLNKEIEKGGVDAVNAGIGHSLRSFLGGFQRGYAGIANFAMLPVAGVFQMAGNNDVANAILDEADEISARGNYNSSVNKDIKNGTLKTAGSVINSAGFTTSMLPLGRAGQAMSVAGNEMKDTLNYRRDNMGKAIATGAAKGIASYIIEGFTGGNLLSKGSLDDFASKTIANKFSSELGKKVASKIYEIGGEIAEEEIENQIDHIIDKMINNKDLPNAEQWMNEAGETAKETFLTTVLLHLLGMGGDTYREVSKYTDNDIETQKYIQEAEKIIKQENLDNKLKQNVAKEQVNAQEQQIISQDNKMAQNGNIEQSNNKYITQEFKQGLEKFKSKKYNQTDNIQVLNELPQYFYNLGYETNEPLYLNMSKLDTVMKTPKGRFKNKNQHGITMDIIEKLPEAINNPLNVIKSRSENGRYNNRFVIITDLTDQYGDIVVIPVEINSNSANILDINKITSIYGKENYDVPYTNDTKSYMDYNKDNIVYDIDNERSSFSNYRLLSPSETKTTSINNIVPPSNENVNTTNYSMQNERNNAQKLPKADKTIQDVGLPTAENTTANEDTSQTTEKADILPVTPEQKARKHYKSIIESNYTTDEAKAIAKELMNSDTYEPESNVKQLETADKRIQTSGAESELNSLMSRAINGGTIKADDIAVGERLIQYYSKTGDKTKLRDAIHATAMAGTAAGQTVQAFNLLNHQTPEGQAIWLQRSVEKMNNDLKKKRGNNAEQFNLTPEMIAKIVSSENTEQLNNNLDEVYKELGQQVSKSTMEKIDVWRYFAMLGNFRTHIRNLSGNFFMGITQDVKNKVAGGIEDVVAKFNPDMERTHTIKRPSQEVLEFAKKDIKNVKAELSGNKYTPKSMLQNNMRTFKRDAMENTLGKLFKWNDTLLEAEDALGLKSGYKKALAEYITANDIDIDNITDKQLAKARRYAVQEAKERAFHQANTIASAINSFTNKNKITKAVGDAAIPFVKTPANIAKTGIEYSPAGLAKSIVYDTVQLRQGNINVNQYIDNLSKGLTGSAITVLGYALAEAGVLKASGGDDEKKEQFDEQSGKQAYSIQIGDKTFSIDWLAPVGIPLMVGAEIHEGLSQNKDEKTSKSSDDEEPLNKFLDRAQVVTDSMASTLNPMVEMSMISGLVSSIRSFAKGDTQALSGMMTNMGKSYINQFVPTGLGHIAKATDTVERDTTSTKSGTVEKAIDSTINQIKSKVPGLRQTLPTKKDIWGEEQKLNDNWALRFIEAGILPMNIKQIKDNKVVNELNRLYEKNGESSVLPTTINKKITIDGQDYRLTNEEFNKYKTSYGRTSYELINNLIGSSDYNKLSEAEKQTAIEKIYTYAKEQIKVDYAKEKNLNYEESKLSQTINAFKKANANVSNYFEYLGQIQDSDKNAEKINILANANYSDKTKEAIYSNSIGTDDSLYSIMKNSGINISKYLNYKTQEFESDKEDDGTTTGKTVSKSKQKKVYDYVNNMKITYEQRLLLLGTQYKLTDQERNNLAKYVSSLKISPDEKLKIFEKLKGFTTYKNGDVKW